MAQEPDARRKTLERDITAWERRALKAERERDKSLADKAAELEDLAGGLEADAGKVSAEAEGHFGDERDVPEGEAAAYLRVAKRLRKRAAELRKGQG